MTNAAPSPSHRILSGMADGLVNIAIVAAVVFLGWSVFNAFTASKAHFPLTAGQRTFATRYCVSELGGTLGGAYVSKPSIFGTTGPVPQLVIRCSFGPKAFLMKVVDLTGSTETPRSGS